MVYTNFTAGNKYDNPESFDVKVYSSVYPFVEYPDVDIYPEKFTLQSEGTKHVKLQIYQPEVPNLWVCTELLPNGRQLMLRTRVCSKLELYGRGIPVREP